MDGYDGLMPQAFTPKVVSWAYRAQSLKRTERKSEHRTVRVAKRVDITVGFRDEVVSCLQHGKSDRRKKRALTPM